MNFRETTLEDIAYVASDLKEWDWLETDISHPQWDKNAMLTHSVNCSEYTLTVELNDEPVGIAGVGGDCIWFLSTPAVSDYPSRVMRLAREFLQRAEDFSYDKLINYVHKDNVTTLRWIKLLGLSVEESGSNNTVKIVWRKTDDN
jgi:hypothetical protein